MSTRGGSSSGRVVMFWLIGELEIGFKDKQIIICRDAMENSILTDTSYKACVFVYPHYHTVPDTHYNFLYILWGIAGKNLKSPKKVFVYTTIQ